RKPRRPRGRPPRPRGGLDVIRHEDCLILDVTALARAGYLAVGPHEGTIPLDGWHGSYVTPRPEGKGAWWADGGELAAGGPADDGPIALVQVACGIHRKWNWRLRCGGCQRPVRKLFRPRLPRGLTIRIGDPVWRCRHCWPVVYRRGGLRDV